MMKRVISVGIQKSSMPMRHLIAIMIVILMMTITSNMSVSSSFSFDSNEKHILEEAYVEIIGSASLFQQETNHNHLDDKLNIGSNANGPTVVETPSQPPPTVSAASSRLTHSIAHDDLVQDKVIFFFCINLQHGGKNAGILHLSVVACNKSGSVIGEFNDVKPSKITCIAEESSKVHGF